MAAIGRKGKGKEGKEGGRKGKINTKKAPPKSIQ
jgi:hypothetical protein